MITYTRALSTAAKRYRARPTTVKKSVLPSRMRVSRKRFTKNYYLSKLLNNLTETKYQGATVDCDAPVAKPGGTQPISYHFWTTGKLLQGQPEFKALNLFQFPKGEANDERIGSTMYIKKSHIKMEVQALPFTDIQTAAGDQPVLEFRLMVVKANRKYNALGQSPAAGDSLFINTQNDQFGYNGTDATVFLNMSQPINKRKWLVYRDQRFKLSTPVLDNQMLDPNESRINASYQKYNTKKYIEFDLPVYKKCKFVDSSTATENVPLDLDSQWLIILQCVKGSYCAEGTSAPRNYALNILGTTSAQDS